MRKLIALVLLLTGGFAGRADAQTGNYQVEPLGVQVELFPGHSIASGFLVKAGPSGVLRDRLFLSLADWEFNRQGNIVYREPGTVRRSAASWLSIQPISLPVAAGEVKAVRITIRVPSDVAPGVYTGAVLVTETTPELPPSFPEVPGVPQKAYGAFTIIVIVRPPVPNYGVDLTTIPR